MLEQILASSIIDKECMYNSVEKMHVDFGTNKGLKQVIFGTKIKSRGFMFTYHLPNNIFKIILPLSNRYLSIYLVRIFSLHYFALTEHMFRK